MANLGQHLRHIISTRIFGRKHSRSDASLPRESFSGPSEMVFNIITNSKVSITKLQQELEFSLSTLDQLSQELSSGATVNHQQNSSLENYPATEILFQPAELKTKVQSKSSKFDLSEISITPVSKESEYDNHELEQILITPL